MNAEYGTCDMCGKETILERTYFEYKINCECHRGEHSEMVRHCIDCVPTIPSEINVPMLTYKRECIEVKFTLKPWYIFGKYKEKLNEEKMKLNINTLKPFDKILVRDNDKDKWNISFYGFYDINYAMNYPYECCGNSFAQCIPYEGNEHLLGTTDDCDNYYKTWK